MSTLVTGDRVRHTISGRTGVVLPNTATSSTARLQAGQVNVQWDGQPNAAQVYAFVLRPITA